MPEPRGRMRSTQADKAAFLRAHPALLEGSDLDVTRALKAAGLVSQATARYHAGVPTLRAMARARFHGAPSERALRATQDYAFEAKALGRHQDVLEGPEEEYRSRDVSGVTKQKPPAGVSPGAEWASEVWERERLGRWKAMGRLTADGTLRVRPDAPKPYTMQDVGRVWPHLPHLDRLAALIHLDGVVEENFMEAHENIRAVVERIADDRLRRVLAEPETQALLAEVVHAQIGAVFGGLLANLSAGKTMSRAGAHGAGRKNKCGKCGTPGHRATTCGRQEATAATEEAGA